MSGSYAGNIGLSWALRANWVEFWFQPKIDLRTRHVCGAEMFARIRHPLHGVVPARTFLIGADRESLDALGEAAVNAARQASIRLNAIGARFPIALNAPADTESCLGMVEAVFDKNRIGTKAPYNLVLDVPEYTILRDAERFMRVAAKLSDHGTKIAVDDFGAQLGAMFRPGKTVSEDEALAHVSQRLLALSDIEVFEFKLDRALVAGCSKEPRKASICRLIVDLVRTLGSTAVAIGLESAADAKCMAKFGCTVGQGHLFSEPVPLVDFMALMKSRVVA